MEEAGLVTKQRVDDPSPRDVYALTDRGRQLEPVLLELARFGLPLLDTPTDEQPMVADRIPLGLRAMMHEPEFPDNGLRIRFDLDEGHHLIAIEPQGRPGRRLLPSERVTVAPVADGESPTADVMVRGTLAGILWIQQGVVDARDGHARRDDRDQRRRRRRGAAAIRLPTRSRAGLRFLSERGRQVSVSRPARRD